MPRAALLFRAHLWGRHVQRLYQDARALAPCPVYPFMDVTNFRGAPPGGGFYFNKNMFAPMGLAVNDAMSG